MMLPVLSSTFADGLTKLTQSEAGAAMQTKTRRSEQATQPDYNPVKCWHSAASDNEWRRTMTKFNIAREFVVLSPKKVAHSHVNSPDFYEQLGTRYGDFKGHELIALHEFQEDWPSWEVHPNGDEIVVLLSGAATFLLKLNDSKREIGLSEPGDSVIVPRGVWHTARIAKPTSVLFITPGEGTLNEYDTTKFDA